MKRWLIAVAVLMFGTASVSLADYIVIRVLLSNAVEPSSSDPNGGISPMGAGNFGIIGGGGMIGGPKGLGNLGGGPPPAVGGAIGGPKVGGGAIGGPKVGGGPPPGFNGAGGARGIMGNSPMGGNLGIMGGSGKSNGQPKQPSETIQKIKFDPNTMVMVAVEMQAPPKFKPLGGNTYPVIEHKWKGSTFVYDDATILVDILDKPSLTSQYVKKAESIKSNRTPDAILTLSEWALMRGLLPESVKLMDELVGIADKDAAKVTGRAAAAVAAYKKVKADHLDKGVAPSAPDDGEKWKGAMGYENVAKSEHYTLVHNADRNAPEVARRLEQLERNYKSALIWFAQRGKALPMPATRMVVVLAEKPEDLTRAKDAFEPGTEMVVDGMFAPRERVAFLCSTRTDAVFHSFARLTRALANDGLSLDDLLVGKITVKKGEKPKTQEELTAAATEIARGQTLALVERALIDESEVSAVSRVGTRQILVAAGMMPRNVDAPEWFDFGLPAVFETPKGPFPSEMTQVKVAFYQGFGMPSWAYMPLWRELTSPPRPEIDKAKAAQYLRDILMDTNFAKAREPVPTTLEPEQLDKALAAKAKELHKARMFAWSFCYFLARQKPAELAKYAQELDALPREIEFDAQVNFNAFARAAGLMKDGKVDPVALKKLADEWLLDMGNQTSPVFEMKLEDPKTDPGAGNAGNPFGGGPPPGGPAGPGGPPPGGAFRPGGGGR